MVTKISLIREIQVGKWSTFGWVFLLATIIVIPSTREVHRFLGSVGLAIYAVGVMAALGLLYKVVIHRFLERISDPQTKWLVAFTVVGLIVLVAIIFPIADSGRISGGSDRDEALTAAAEELMHGRYPYTPEDYEGGPITPFPGAVFLAIPFVLLGNVAYQSVFWLGIAFLVFRSYFKDARKALLFLWTILALAPVLLQQLVTGADLVSNALYLVAFMWLLSSSIDGGSGWSRRGILASILLGIGLAFRLNYLLLTPLIFAMVVKGKIWKEAISHSLIAGATFAAVASPFYFYDRGGFSPLHAQDAASPNIPDIISNNLGFLPDDAAVVLAIPAVILVVVLASRFQGSSFRSLMINSAMVQFALFMPFFILTTYQANSLVFAFSDFGIAYLIFGALAIWPSLARAPSDGRVFGYAT